MASGIITFDDLRELSRLGPRATLATVERWAAREGIRYRYDGKGGIWTTMDALNAALGLAIPGVEEAPYSPNDLF